jgi:hypothetical protein
MSRIALYGASRAFLRGIQIAIELASGIADHFDHTGRVSGVSGPGRAVNGVGSLLNQRRSTPKGLEHRGLPVHAETSGFASNPFRSVLLSFDKKERCGASLLFSNEVREYRIMNLIY